MKGKKHNENDAHLWFFKSFEKYSWWNIESHRWMEWEWESEWTIVPVEWFPCIRHTEKYARMHRYKSKHGKIWENMRKTDFFWLSIYSLSGKWKFLVQILRKCLVWFGLKIRDLKALLTDDNTPLQGRLGVDAKIVWYFKKNPRRLHREREREKIKNKRKH